MSSIFLRFKGFTLPALITGGLLIGCTATPSIYTEIPMDDFYDAIKHWNDRTGETGVEHYEPHQIREIANNILLYQRENGAWPVNKHPLRVLSDEERAQLEQERSWLDGSFDNRNIYPQVEYLSWAYLQTGDVRYRDGALLGLRYTLGTQYDNGGWAHSPERTEMAYYKHITFADDIMPGVLAFLRRVASAQHPYGYINTDMRSAAAVAVERGDHLILDLQIRQGDQLAAWAGQYDENTLKPATGRSYELPAVVTWESVSVVEYLMSIDNPSDEVVQAVEGAIDWFERSKLTGLRVEHVEIEPIRFNFHTATHDRVLVEDPDAEALWARFYDLDTNEPFWTNRDGSRVGSMAEVHIERRTGYDWYGTWPKTLLEEDYPAWRERLGL